MDDLSPNQANRLSGAQGYWGTAFVLALIAHGLLFVLLFVSMQWRSEPTGPVYAELWNGDMQAAEAPAETQPEPQPELEPEPQPEPEPAPQPEPEPEPEPPAPEEPQQLPPPPPPIAQTDLDRQANLLEDPDIVQERLDREKKKQEEEKQRILERERQMQEAKRAEEQRKAEEARQAELRRQEEQQRIQEQKRLEELKKQEEQKRLAEEKRKAEERAEAERKAKQEELKKQAQERERKIAEEKAQREKALAEKRKAQEELNRQRAEEQANAARRKEMLSRLTGQSGSAMGAGSGAMTNFQQAQYNNRIVACIRPHITFNTPAGAKRGMYVAKFDVRLLKNGQKAVPPKMLSSSGLKAFDTAVEKAILMCNPFPKPPVGDIPSSITLTFDPVDDARSR